MNMTAMSEPQKDPGTSLPHILRLADMRAKMKGGSATNRLLVKAAIDTFRSQLHAYPKALLDLMALVEGVEGSHIPKYPDTVEAHMMFALSSFAWQERRWEGVIPNDVQQFTVSIPVTSSIRKLEEKDKNGIFYAGETSSCVFMYGVGDVYEEFSVRVRNGLIVDAFPGVVPPGRNVDALRNFNVEFFRRTDKISGPELLNSLSIPYLHPVHLARGDQGEWNRRFHEALLKLDAASEKAVMRNIRAALKREMKRERPWIDPAFAGRLCGLFRKQPDPRWLRRPTPMLLALTPTQAQNIVDYRGQVKGVSLEIIAQEPGQCMSLDVGKIFAWRGQWYVAVCDITRVETA